MGRKDKGRGKNTIILFNRSAHPAWAWQLISYDARGWLPTSLHMAAPMLPNGSQIVPKWLPNGSQTAPKWLQDSSGLLKKDFPQLQDGLKWFQDVPRGPQDAPRCSKMAPKSPKMGAQWPQHGPRWPQDRVKLPQKLRKNGDEKCYQKTYRFSIDFFEFLYQKSIKKYWKIYSFFVETSETVIR